eukprot:1161045-Pelagomonas_calceolata.AAC.1
MHAKGCVGVLSKASIMHPTTNEAGAQMNAQGEMRPIACNCGVAQIIAYLHSTQLDDNSMGRFTGCWTDGNEYLIIPPMKGAFSLPGQCVFFFPFPQMLKAPQLTWTEAYLPQKRNSMHFVNIHAELAAELRLYLSLLLTAQLILAPCALIELGQGTANVWFLRPFQVSFWVALLLKCAGSLLPVVLASFMHVVMIVCELVPWPNLCSRLGKKQAVEFYEFNLTLLALAL